LLSSHNSAETGIHININSCSDLHRSMIFYVNSYFNDLNGRMHQAVFFLLCMISRVYELWYSTMLTSLRAWIIYRNKTIVLSAFKHASIFVTVVVQSGHQMEKS